MQIVNSRNIGTLIQRTLNHVDGRLVDHGERVARYVANMMEVHGGYSVYEKRDICFLALIHDIGAYKTEEISRMLEFETQNVWEHSVYGYLFVRYLTPLQKLSPAILFHHLDYEILRRIDTPCAAAAQMIYLADRVDVFLENGGTAGPELMDYLEEYRDKRFSGEVIDLFWEAYARFPKGKDTGRRCELEEELCQAVFTEEEIDAYLKMLIYVIDFRSRHTVTHTITTTTISRELAMLMQLSEQEQQRVAYGAELHDLGKVGIPVEILEFPGKLSPQAMRVMRTHVDMTKDILGSDVDETTARIAVRHHEKLDGSGYPLGLAGEDLTVCERIVAVADIVSALCGTRSYKEAFPKEKVLSIIGSMAQEEQIDKEIVRLIEENFDSIIGRVQEASGPLLALYHKIGQEYEDLIRNYDLIVREWGEY